VTPQPAHEPDWATRSLDALDRGIDAVRRRTTRPAVGIVRGLVFAAIIVTGVAVAVVLALIAVVRGVHALLGIWWSEETATWAGYLILGACFVVAGAFAMSRRSGVQGE